MRDKTDVFIAEDHPIFRKGLVEIINSEPAYRVCGESDNHLDSIGLIKKLSPGFIIVDITLKNSSGLDLIKDIKLYMPGVPVLALSMHDENIYAERALRSGASGYLMKQEAPEVLIFAMERILKGGVYLSEAMSSSLLKKIASGSGSSGLTAASSLSDRELEVFTMTGRGMKTRDIAGFLHISVKTVENHKSKIKQKLDIADGVELIRKATLWVQEHE